MIRFGFNKRLKEVWGDETKITLINREIIKEKPVLKRLLLSYYQEMISFLNPDGPTLEIGSGGGFLKECFPQAITSDVLPLPGVDIICDATDMGFKNGSIGNILLRGVLHHINDPMKFFEECNRVLCQGGRVIINDPYISPFSYFINKYLHFEPCDLTADWKFEKGKPLMDCNLAMGTIIFKKRISEFREKYPQLKIIHTNYHSFFIYLLSGGYSYPSFIPTWSFNFFMGIEKLLDPFRLLLANIVFIVIEKEHYRGEVDAG